MKNLLFNKKIPITIDKPLSIELTDGNLSFEASIQNGYETAKSSDNTSFQPTKNLYFETLVTVIAPNYLPSNIHVDFCVAILCRFKATCDNLLPQFSLTHSTSEQIASCSPDSGEQFVAQSWETTSTKITIGTEDEEALLHRAKFNNYMPRRLYEKDLISPNMFSYSEKALSIQFPMLMENEVGQIQFVAATKKISDGNLTDTWLAADLSPEAILRDYGE